MKVIWMETLVQPLSDPFENTIISEDDPHYPVIRDSIHIPNTRIRTQQRQQHEQSELERRARQRKRVLTQKWIEFVDRRWIPLWNLLGWMHGLSGRMGSKKNHPASADLAMVLLGWTYTDQRRRHTHAATIPSSSSPKSPLFVDYAHRRWLWEEAWQTWQLYFSGLTWIHKIWGPVLYDRVFIPLYNRYRWWIISQHKQQKHKQNAKKLSCPVCGESPTNATFVQPCKHVYCYACFYKHHPSTAARTKHSADADLGRCWECGDRITHAKDIFSEME
jgi:hypothetical protein